MCRECLILTVTSQRNDGSIAHVSRYAYVSFTQYIGGFDNSRPLWVKVQAQNGRTVIFTPL